MIAAARNKNTFECDTTPTLEAKLNQILLVRNLPGPARDVIDETATALWNACSRTLGSIKGNQEKKKALAGCMLLFRLLSVALPP